MIARITGLLLAATMMIGCSNAMTLGLSPVERLALSARVFNYFDNDGDGTVEIFEW